MFHTDDRAAGGNKSLTFSTGPKLPGILGGQGARDDVFPSQWAKGAQTLKILGSTSFA